MLALLVVLSVWLFAPLDLVPSWAALGSSNDQQTMVIVIRPSDGNHAPPSFKYFPDGFVRGLTGLRLSEAEARVRELGNPYMSRVQLDNFHGQPGDSAFYLTRVDFTVFLGRVARSTIG